MHHLLVYSIIFKIPGKKFDLYLKSAINKFKKFKMKLKILNNVLKNDQKLSVYNDYSL